MHDEVAKDTKTVTITEVDPSKVAEVKAELNQLHKNDIVKDLYQTTEDHLEQTAYHWWWKFVRAGVKQSSMIDELAKDAGKAAALQRVIDDFEPNGDAFKVWWQRKGRDLFKEDTVPHIIPMGITAETKDGFTTPYVALLVPLSISKKLLVAQFKLIIDSYFPENYMRHAASTAKRKINPTKKDKSADFQYLLDVWTARRENPSLPFWHIHCLATKSDVLLEEIKKKDSANSIKLKLKSQAEQAYKQADELMRNALIGHFPKDDEFQKKKRGGETSATKKAKKAK
jgi:hypothetical protein